MPCPHQRIAVATRHIRHRYLSSGPYQHDALRIRRCSNRKYGYLWSPAQHAHTVNGILPKDGSLTLRAPSGAKRCHPSLSQLGPRDDYHVLYPQRSLSRGLDRLHHPIEICLNVPFRRNVASGWSGSGHPLKQHHASTFFTNSVAQPRPGPVTENVIVAERQDVVGRQLAPDRVVLCHAVEVICAGMLTVLNDAVALFDVREHPHRDTLCIIRVAQTVPHDDDLVARQQRLCENRVQRLLQRGTPDGGDDGGERGAYHAAFLFLLATRRHELHTPCVSTSVTKIDRPQVVQTTPCTPRQMAHT